MIVVSDTTPLISLMKISQLKLVYQLFGEICIPEAVYNELIVNNRFPQERQLIMESEFIKVIKVDDAEAVNLLCRSTGLDIGEGEAIILSDNNKADLLLMDEVSGRNVAKKMGIQIMGTVGMLLVAHKEGLLSREDVLNCVETLKVTGRHISDKLYEQLLKKLEA